MSKLREVIGAAIAAGPEGAQQIGKATIFQEQALAEPRRPTEVQAEYLEAAEPQSKFIAPPPPAPKPVKLREAPFGPLLLAALTALSQRALLALAALRGLLLALSCFGLAWKISSQPSWPNLALLGLYAALVATLEWRARL